jgi:hypothetical protein
VIAREREAFSRASNRGYQKVLAGFLLRRSARLSAERVRREDVSLREPSSSDRKNVAPLEPSRWRGGPTGSNIAQINKRRPGDPRYGVAFDQTAARDSLRDVFRATVTV